tara:strand:- start:134 stop:334 length:201 start_codon:yes stop_codon:yes gene_type:complete
MKIKVTDIVYDTRDICDGHIWDQNELELPSEMILEVDGVIDIESEIADAICDTTGWCVSSYNYEVL